MRSELVMMTAVFACLASAATAQLGDTIDSTVRLGGAMHAAARVCGGYSQAQLDQMKSMQKSQAMQRGMSSVAFENIFAAAFRQVQDQMAKAPPAKKKQTCDQLRGMAGK